MLANANYLFKNKAGENSHRKKALLRFNHLCIGFAQGKLIASDGNFHRVTQWRNFADIHLDTLCDTHVHDSALYRTFAGQLFDTNRLTDLCFS